jgi:hypothetical protein
MKRKTFLKALIGIPIVGAFVQAKEKKSPYKSKKVKDDEKYWAQKTSENLAKVKGKPGLHWLSPSCGIYIPDDES